MNLLWFRGKVCFNKDTIFFQKARGGITKIVKFRNDIKKAATNRFLF